MVNRSRRAAIGRGVIALAVGALSATAVAGDLNHREMALKAFSKVRIDLPADIFIAPAANSSARIEAEQAVLDKISLVVSGDTLVLEAKGSFQTQKAITVQIGSAGSISHLAVMGASTVEFSGTANENLAVLVDGSSDLALHQLNLNKLTLDIQDSGSVTASGKSTGQVASVSGAGSYEGESLSTKTAKLMVSDSGEANVRVSKSLNVRVSDAGTVTYAGKATVNKDIRDAGSLERI